MNWWTGVLTLIIGSAPPPDTVVPELHESGYSLLKGVVSGGRVYTCGKEKFQRLAWRNLYWVNLDGTKSGSNSSATAAWALPGCWDVAYGRFWWGGVVHQTDAHETKEELTTLHLDDFRSDNERSGPDAAPGKGDRFMLTGFDAHTRLRLLWRWMLFAPTLNLTFLPLSEDTTRIFIVTNIRGFLESAGESKNLKGGVIRLTDKEMKTPKWTLRVFHYKAGWSAAKRRWVQDEGKWRQEEIVLDPPFRDTFHAFQRGTTYYFVTDSGKVYAAPKPAKGPRKFVTIHADKKRPVVAVLTDDKAKRTFVFCEAPKSTKGVLLELVDKAKPIAYDRAKVPTVKLKEPLKRVLEYTRVLQANKLLKAK